MNREKLIRILEKHACPLRVDKDLEVLFDRIGDARCVFLGEATHGTKEFYHWRGVISKFLIAKKGFSLVLVEGDWPDCYRVNRFAKGYVDADQEAKQALETFRRWPTWMWANEEMREWLQWLHGYNNNLPKSHRVGFFGLDLYSLWESMEVVTEYLKKHDPKALRDVYWAYSCFEPFNRSEHNYAAAARMTPGLCEQEVVRLLTRIRQSSKSRHPDDLEADFDAEQNTWIIKNAEHYYRMMLGADEKSWNVRNKHMMDTLNRLLQFHGPQSKVIVWAHNSHVGDARATPMHQAGMVSLGQLARKRYGKKDVFLLGFGTYRGEVLAGRSWGSPMIKMPIPPALEESWEEVMHEVDTNDKIFIFDKLRGQMRKEKRWHRAIGVLYHPASEAGNYVPTVLTERYDAFIHVDRTHALNPLIVRQAA